MRKKHIILLILCLLSIGISAQTLEQAKTFFQKKEYAKAKPIFLKYLKGSPNNGSYNHWYGVCCYETGERKEAEKYLLKGAEKKVQDSYLYLGQLYFDEYRFDESVSNYEDYIAMLIKRKQPAEKYEKLLADAKLGARMLKGVEEVTFIDSFVVDKSDFLKTYKISEESGRIATYDEYFNTKGQNQGTVYQTQLGSKRYFGDKKEKYINLYSQSKMLDNWGKASLLPGIDSDTNSNYPYVLSDGITLYYASQGDNSIGGYDIFVTRYNSDNDTYLTPDNIGMPFNSPFNDYMYVIDEYNNLGWFASDRFQPDGKVCIYVFIPNESKQVYNYEATDANIIRRAAIIRSVKGTWKNMEQIKAARQRLTMVTYNQPAAKPEHDFDFIINDNTIYHTLGDFTSAKAKTLLKQWQQKGTDYEILKKSLENKRKAYSESSKQKKTAMTPEILDLEKRIEQMGQELNNLEANIRNEENKNLTK